MSAEANVFSVGLRDCACVVGMILREFRCGQGLRVLFLELQKILLMQIMPLDPRFGYAKTSAYACEVGFGKAKL